MVAPAIRDKERRRSSATGEREDQGPPRSLSSLAPTGLDLRRNTLSATMGREGDAQRLAPVAQGNDARVLQITVLL